MATIYSAPADIALPKIDYRNYCPEQANKAEEEYIQALASWVQDRNPNNDMVGEVIHFPVADGYARYMVAGTNPDELVFLELGDCYRIPEAHERGLNTDDITMAVRRRRAVKELFSNKLH